MRRPTSTAFRRILPRLGVCRSLFPILTLLLSQGRQTDSRAGAAIAKRKNLQLMLVRGFEPAYATLGQRLLQLAIRLAR